MVGCDGPIYILINKRSANLLTTSYNFRYTGYALLYFRLGALGRYGASFLFIFLKGDGSDD